MTTYSTRYRQLAEQRAYQRRASSLAALLAPYTRIPAQRRGADRVAS